MFQCSYDVWWQTHQLQSVRFKIAFLWEMHRKSVRAMPILLWLFDQPGARIRSGWGVAQEPCPRSPFQHCLSPCHKSSSHLFRCYCFLQSHPLSPRGTHHWTPRPVGCQCWLGGNQTQPMCGWKMSCLGWSFLEAACCWQGGQNGSLQSREASLWTLFTPRFSAMVCHCR